MEKMKHSRFGYSAVAKYEQCPFSYKLRFLDNLETLPSTDPRNALILGKAIHTGIEIDVQTALRQYYSAFSDITDQHINEAIKLEYLIPMVKEILPKGQHEVTIEDENFMGTLDLLVPVGDGLVEAVPGKMKQVELYDLYDFKYTRNPKYYEDSKQLHLYKYYFEKLNPFKRIRNMCFVIIPKIQLEWEFGERLWQYRGRLIQEVRAAKIERMRIEYDPNKVIGHLESCQDILTSKNFERNPSWLCGWCEYRKYCQSYGTDDQNIIYPKEK